MMASNYETDGRGKNILIHQLIQANEPEGIYLSPPFRGNAQVIQRWGDNPDYYAKATYYGVPLKGYMGVGFELKAGSEIVAPDDGRVAEISYDFGGLGKYIKLEHWWGESIYANLRSILVDAGQKVKRAQAISTVGSGLFSEWASPFWYRIKPYDRWMVEVGLPIRCLFYTWTFYDC
ncbi:MAG: M23 family metallopeptidase [Caldilineaceae bacterium]